MKIDFRQLKYILPLILLPFMVLLNYGMLSFSEEGELVQDKGKAAIQEGVGSVSDQIRNRGIDDKLDAFRSRYKRGDGYTAIKNLRIEVEGPDKVQSQYNVAEKRLLDSIDHALRNSMTQTPAYSGESTGNNPRQFKFSPPVNQEDKDLPRAINQFQESGNGVEKPRYEDPMDLFRAQMALIDSIAKANDTLYQQKKSVENAPIELPESPKFKVKKAGHQNEHFNTVTRKEKKSFIKAIVDEEIKKGTLGERLRIRLLDDIQVGGTVLKQGTYLYALISGYEAQRVKLSIVSVMVEDKILPVQLHVYDNDGIEGLYVPASSFREFSKDLGGNATGGLNLQMQQNPSSVNQFYMSTLQRLVTSTSQAMSKTIRQNKANLKYGTIVYLIDPEELREDYNANTEHLNP